MDCDQAQSLGRMYSERYIERLIINTNLKLDRHRDKNIKTPTMQKTDRWLIEKISKRQKKIFRQW